MLMYSGSGLTTGVLVNVIAIFIGSSLIMGLKGVIRSGLIID